MAQMTKVSGRYGAPMGRPSHGIPENCEPRSIRLFRVRLDSGGYDDGGAYWGHGAPIWCATDGGDFFQTVRAGSRIRAALELGLAEPGKLARPLYRDDVVRYLFATIDGRAPGWTDWDHSEACELLAAYGVATGRASTAEAPACHN